MKRCPNCNRTYTDDSLSFCLQDGTPLVAPEAPPARYETSPPSRHSQSRPSPPGTGMTPPDTPLVNQMRVSPTWSPMPGPQPRGRSVWPWIIGIVLILAFMGLGVAILILALTNMKRTNPNVNVNVRTVNRNTNQWNANVNSARPTHSDDFSVQNWLTGTYAYGTAWYKDGEYHLRAKPGGYIVMYAPNKNYQTENANVRVTTRSVEGDSPTIGYGLVVHSEKAKGSEDIGHYAFLIRNETAADFQVVRYRGATKYVVKDWTRSPYIRTGTNTNQLQVVARNRLLTFYVNGQMMTSVIAMPNLVRGVVGFYTSDAHEVAFDNLEIVR